MIDHFFRAVVVIGDYDARAMRFHFFRRGIKERHHDDLVANARKPGSRAIDADDSAPRLAGDDVSFKTVPIVAISHENGFIRIKPRSPQKIAVDGNAAVIVDVSKRDGSAVDFCFEESDEHSRTIVGGRR